MLDVQAVEKIVDEIRPGVVKIALFREAQIFIYYLELYLSCNDGSNLGDPVKSLLSALKTFSDALRESVSK